MYGICFTVPLEEQGGIGAEKRAGGNTLIYRKLPTEISSILNQAAIVNPRHCRGSGKYS